MLKACGQRALAEALSRRQPVVDNDVEIGPAAEKQDSGLATVQKPRGTREQRILDFELLN